ALRHERELVGRIRARCGVSALTASRSGTAPRFVDCGDGITTYLGVEPADLVNDIRFIAPAVEARTVHDELAALEDQKEVRSPETRARLWALLQNSVSDDPEFPGLGIAPPSDLLSLLRTTRSFSLHLGSKVVASDQETLFELLMERI